MALDFLAGCAGGCAGVVVGYPLDTVKVRLQTQDLKNPVYRGTFHCLRSTIQQESVRGLFKGMSSPLASVAVINAMIFGVYGNVQRRLNNPDSLRSHALAGSIAGLVQSFVCSPMELVKTRLQIQEQVCAKGVQLYKGPLDCLHQIWHKEGVRGIFRGLTITISREIPAFGLYFSSYEVMTRRADPTQPISTIHMMAAGGFAGVFSWLFTYPIDFLKSRLQVDGLAGERVYNGIRDCVLKIYQQEGIRGFFRGMNSTLIRSFPVNAVTFSVVTWILRWASPFEEESVTYQKDVSALFMHDSFAQVHEINWTAEWKNSLGIQLVLANSGSSAPWMRSSSIMTQYRDALVSFANQSRSSNVAEVGPPSCRCFETSSSSDTTSNNSQNKQDPSFVCQICQNHQSEEKLAVGDGIK